LKRTQWIALAAIALLGAVVLLFVLRNRQPPFLPNDSDHAWNGAESCLECHAPQDPNHPVGQDCMRCHGVVR
jgi:hypothetical protein